MRNITQNISVKVSQRATIMNVNVSNPHGAQMLTSTQELPDNLDYTLVVMVFQIHFTEILKLYVVISVLP